MEVFSYEELCIIKEAIDFARGEDTYIDDKLYGRVWSKVLDLITFDIDKELERVIRIIIRRHACGTASEAELQILPKLIEMKLGFCGGALWIRDKEQS